MRTVRRRGGEMSDETHAALTAAIAAHVADTGDGRIVTDWALVAATTSLEDIGTGRTSYLLEGNQYQPVHVMAGLFHWGRENAVFSEDDDDD